MYAINWSYNHIIVPEVVTYEESLTLCLSLHGLVCTCNIYLLHQTTWWPEEWDSYIKRDIHGFIEQYIIPNNKRSSLCHEREH